MSAEDYFIEQRSLGVPIGEIAQNIFPNISKSAAYQRLRRVRLSGFDESRRSTRNLQTAYEISSVQTYTWRTQTGTVLVQNAAVREDKMTIEELRYLAESGQIDTRRKAKQFLREIANELGYEFSADMPRELVVDRPTVQSTAGGEPVEYLFGRRRSDIQRARMRAQLRAKGIKWNKQYADFAGYGGL